MRIRDYFERVYVINLKNRPERLRSITQELKRNGLDFSPGKVELFSAEKPEAPAGFPDGGWRGCVLSHLEVIKRARKDHLPNVLIMEDDCAISRRLSEYQKDLVSHLQRHDWDLVYFGHFVQCPKARAITLVEFSGEILGAHLYAVHSRIYDRLIAFFEAYLKRVDQERPAIDVCFDGILDLFRQKYADVITLLASPAVAAQKDFPSDLIFHTGKMTLKRFLKQLPGAREIAEWIRPFQ